MGMNLPIFVQIKRFNCYKILACKLFVHEDYHRSILDLDFLCIVVLKEMIVGLCICANTHHLLLFWLHL